MEVEEIEAALEKIWDLHDKLSDAIHSISRTHFLNSIKNPRKSTSSDEFCFNGKKKTIDETASGFVFVKGLRFDDDDSVVQEAKSLYAIRNALENLEDQLEFFHTVQTQQQAERDAAVARLEQSRIVLAMRLAEHDGKKYKVIEEARALVGDVREAGRFVSPENIYGPSAYPSGQNFVSHEDKKSNVLVNFLLSSFSFVSKSLKFDHMSGIFGNAALFAISMLAFMHLNQVSGKEKYALNLDLPPTQDLNYTRDTSKVYRTVGSSSGGHSKQLDVMSARG
ncbi:Plastid division protein PDV1 [Abeliophyllum distichum]|uniref:Plastid division protein PDV1 n=1 Tax=Abeliophyllum distichum TaxID=126358 RepID=A0ABD1VS63_9LAMI